MHSKDAENSSEIESKEIPRDINVWYAFGMPWRPGLDPKDSVYQRAFCLYHLSYASVACLSYSSLSIFSCSLPTPVICHVIVLIMVFILLVGDETINHSRGAAHSRAHSRARTLAYTRGHGSASFRICFIAISDWLINNARLPVYSRDVVYFVVDYIRNHAAVYKPTWGLQLEFCI